MQLLLLALMRKHCVVQLLPIHTAQLPRTLGCGALHLTAVSLRLHRIALLQSLAQNVAEAYYRLEPFLRAAVRSFVRQHLDTFAENEDGSDKQVLGCLGPLSWV